MWQSLGDYEYNQGAGVDDNIEEEFPYFKGYLDFLQKEDRRGHYGATLEDPLSPLLEWPIYQARDDDDDYDDDDDDDDDDKSILWPR